MEKDQNKEVKCGVPDLLQLYQSDLIISIDIIFLFSNKR